MKRCPACQRTFDDSQNFCQTDGTRLEEIGQTGPELQKTMLAPPPPQSSRDLQPTQYDNPHAPQWNNAQPQPQWQGPNYPPQNPSWNAPVSQTGGKPALIGGLLIGVLSALSIVGAALGHTAGANLAPCCSLFAALGGALAAYLLIKSSARPVRTGEGALKGLKA